MKHALNFDALDAVKDKIKKDDDPSYHEVEDDSMEQKPGDLSFNQRPDKKIEPFTFGREMEGSSIHSYSREDDYPQD